MPSSCESSCETLMSNLTEVNAQKLSLPLNSTFEVSRAETIGKSGCGSLSNRQNCGGAAVIVSHVSHKWQRKRHRTRALCLLRGNIPF